MTRWQYCQKLFDSSKGPCWCSTNGRQGSCPGFCESCALRRFQRINLFFGHCDAPTACSSSKPSRKGSKLHTGVKQKLFNVWKELRHQELWSRIVWTEDRMTLSKVRSSPESHKPSTIAELCCHYATPDCLSFVSLQFAPLKFLRLSTY